jgi:DNA-binding Lrp family transcriptional regulator
MPAVKFVFTALQARADRKEYEQFLQEVDYPEVVKKLRSIKKYRAHRFSSPFLLNGNSYDYLEVIAVESREAYEEEIRTSFQEVIRDLYTRFLDRNKTVSVWSEEIEPAL